MQSTVLHEQGRFRGPRNYTVPCSTGASRRIAYIKSMTSTQPGASDSLLSTFGGQQDGDPRRLRALHWLYPLVLVPFVTDLAETGHWPTTPREWISEVVAGFVIAALIHKVRNEHQTVLAQARTDALTGLWNRRSFDEALTRECVRAQRSRQPLALVYLDLDNFKVINDRHGHQEGDRVLKLLAQAVTAVVRLHVDRSFRLGGDEFSLLLPGTTLEHAEAVVQRLREHCAKADAVWTQGMLGISAGVVVLGADESHESLRRRADEAIYQHKRSAR